jgi:hypothetical protein
MCLEQLSNLSKREALAFLRAAFEVAEVVVHDGISKMRKDLLEGDNPYLCPSAFSIEKDDAEVLGLAAAGAV